jgi:hypothetical protein
MQQNPFALQISLGSGENTRTKHLRYVPVTQGMAFEYLEDQKTMNTVITQLRKGLSDCRQAADNVRLISPQPGQMPVFATMGVDLQPLLSGKLDPAFLQAARDYIGFDDEDQVCTTSGNILRFFPPRLFDDIDHTFVITVRF